MFEKDKHDKISGEELNYIAESKDALLHNSPKYSVYIIFLLLSVIAVTLIWSYFSMMDISIQAAGRASTSSDLQVIQNLEGGIVKAINVNEGDIVKKDQVLVRLDDTRFASQFKKELLRKATLEAEMLRLEAEANGSNEINFPKVLKEQYPDIVKHSNDLFENNNNAYKTSLKILNESLYLAKKQLNIIVPLAKRGAMSQIELIQAQRDVNAIEVKINEKENETRTTARKEWNQNNEEYVLLEEQLLSSEDKTVRTIVRSPVDGVINKIYVSTIGEVINPGDKIMDIVPTNDTVTFTAKVSTSSIGFIKVGQKANVRVSAFDYAVYGSIDGTVAQISPDAITDTEGNHFYEVKIVSPKTYLGSTEKPLRIKPGMDVNINITTGKRSIMAYYLQPYLTSFGLPYENGK